MILADMNQVMISNIMKQIGNHTNIKFDEDLIRHMVLNSIRSYRQKFVYKYGELILCFDDRDYWRKDFFPYYKANRKKAQEKSEVDWKELFRILSVIRDELKEYFPYKVIQVDHAEADDTIGTLCHEYGAFLNHGGVDDILILSADKDFVQLQTYSNVSQYNPVMKHWVKHADPQQYLIEHILRGDSGGIVDDVVKRNFNRNQHLIDLSFVPVDIKKQILDKYNQENGDRSKLYKYFIAKGLKHLHESIGEF